MRSKKFFKIFVAIVIFAVVLLGSPVYGQGVDQAADQLDTPDYFGGIHLDSPEEVVVQTGRRFQARWTMTCESGYINILIYNESGELIIGDWVEISAPVGSQGFWVIPNTTGIWHARVELVSGDTFELLDTQTNAFHVVGKVFLPLAPGEGSSTLQ